jgi:hypothetical protein
VSDFLGLPLPCGKNQGAKKKTSQADGRKAEWGGDRDAEENGVAKIFFPMLATLTGFMCYIDIIK